MDAALAYRTLDQHLTMDRGKFYGGAGGLTLGAGCLYQGINCPIYDCERRRFRTGKGSVYVLTHECDLDAKDFFHEFVLVVPIIKFEDFVSELSKSLDTERLKGLISNIAQNRVHRLQYLPSLPPPLPMGGVMYLNQMCHAHRDEFQSNGAGKLATVTAYGLQIVDYCIWNHLFRPKMVPLPLQEGY